MNINIMPGPAHQPRLIGYAPEVTNQRARHWLRKTDLDGGCGAQEAAEIEKMRAAGWRPEWSGVT